MSPREFAKLPWVKRLMYFFPLQLVLVHISRNHIILLLWAMLFGYVTNQIGLEYGVPYLFLDPEYMGQVSYWSYFIMGLATGGFIMAFHITSYITDCRKFSFIATLSKPFYKFSVNNSGIPLAFIVTHAYCIFMFRYKNEFGSTGQIVGFVAAYLFGVFTFITLTMTYFFSANRDITHFNTKPRIKPSRLKIKRIKLEGGKQWTPDVKSYKTEVDWNVEMYLSHPFKMALARDTEHYDRVLLLRVFRQNHNSAFVFTVLLFISLLLFGYFRDYKYFQIPAGACIFMMATMVVMLAGAIYAFFRKWTSTFIIGMVVLANFLSNYDFFRVKNYAYGLDYSATPAVYSDSILCRPDNKNINYNNDKRETIKVLENWRTRQVVAGNKKPKFVIINASGGGQKASLWTFYSLQMADSLLNGRLLPNTQFMTGSSGGMVGLAYIRELYLRKQLGQPINLYDRQYFDNIGKDILNTMAASIAFNDLFIRLQHFRYDDKIYTKDRGSAFEQQLIANTDGYLEHNLGYYTEPEKKAMIPTMVFTPTIINDGRRLVISSQYMSYLTDNSSHNFVNNPNITEDVEFLRLFQKQGATNLRFTSAIRMSGSFPYILPSVTLPTTPEMQIMDAGLRDNYGLKTALRYIYTFKEWIRANTSGVIIIQTREAKTENGKSIPIKQSMIESITSPVGNLYANIFKTQDYTLDELLSYSSEWANMPVDVINLELSDVKNDHVSLNLHLTSLEKERVRNAIKRPENQRAIDDLRKLLE